MQTQLIEKPFMEEGDEAEFYAAITSDVSKNIIQFISERGHGKALTIDTPIPTIDGWKKMEYISAGDMVFDENGNPCEVLAVSPIMYNHEVYEVEFDDGAKIKADKEHLWFTSTRNSRLAEYRRKTLILKHGQNFETIKTTEEIKNTLKAQKGREINHVVKVAKALNLPNRELPIPPYTLGAWLGNGTSENGTITTSDEEVINRIIQDGFELKKQKAIMRFNIIGLYKKLRENNLLKNKHIPQIYLRSGTEQRIELLKGLMDTDGMVSKDHNTSFCVTKEKLAYNVSELIHSIGIRHRFIIHDAKIYGRYISKRYRFRFSTPLNLFNVKRKHDRVFQEKYRITRGRRYILNVKEIPTEPVKCITVDSPSHLYLAGRQMIPTHNSSALKTIVKRSREAHPELVFIAFDVSQSWYEFAPLKYRQLVTVEKIRAGQIVNVEDCIYEMGSLSEAQRRQFIGTIIAQTYRGRYDMKLNNPEAFVALPTLVFIVEESNVVFGSFSFRVKDWISPVLADFVSVGRNYKLSAILVATVEEGEMAPSLRRRSRRIYGRLVAEGDISRVRRNNKDMARYLSQEIPRFNFVYWGEKFIGPVKVPDEVKTPAIDYIVENPADETSSGFNLNWWIQFCFGALLVVLLIAYFKGI